MKTIQKRGYERAAMLFVMMLTTLTMFGQESDTTIVLSYGEMVPVDTVTISKSSATFKQLQEAENLVKDITDQRTKNKAVVDYVLSKPESDGSVYLLNHLKGVSTTKRCLAAISERARNGVMKKLYDAFDEGMKQFEEFTASTAEACQVGKEAKDFALEDLNGQQLSLSSLRGKYVLLDFWGSWCVNCIAAFPRMKAFYAQHRDKLEILGVAIHDEKGKWKAAVEKNELPWKLVLDTEGESSVAERYGIVAAPTYVLIDPEGKVLNWNLGELETFEDYF